MGKVANLHHTSSSTQGLLIRSARLHSFISSAPKLLEPHEQLLEEDITYPVAADSDIKNDIIRALTEPRPHSRVIDPRTSDLMEPSTVAIPSNGLFLPVRAPAVKLQTKNVIFAVLGASPTANTRWLVADTAGCFIAVSSAVDSLLSVDVLKDIEFAAGGPGNAVSV